MADLVVRDLDDGLDRRLRERAMTHGRSVEDEARNILVAALDAPGPGAGGTGTLPGLGTRMARRFAGLGCKVEDFPEIRGEEVRAADFG